MKIIALGRTDLLYNTIVHLHEEEHQILSVITTKTSQYQYQRTPNDFKSLCKDIGAEFVLTENLSSKDIFELVSGYKPDIGISVNWSTIIPDKILELFPASILNAHAGDLPRYRGNSVRNWAIISGENQMALTIHQMGTALDSGNILLKERFPINSSTTIGDLYNFVDKNIPTLFSRAIKGLSDGSIVPEPQDNNLSLRCYPRLPIDSQIDWNDTAEEIDRVVRASSEPFSGAYSFLNGEKIIIWKSTVKRVDYDYLASPGQVVERNSESGVLVSTGKYFLLIKDAETSEHGRTNPTKIINTIRTRLGMDYSKEMVDLKKRLLDLEQRIIDKGEEQND